MPFSREQRHLDSLLRTVTEYRQVIGQPRQDDLLHFLSEGGPTSQSRTESDGAASEGQAPSGGRRDLADLLGMDLEPPPAT